MKIFGPVHFTLLTLLCIPMLTLLASSAQAQSTAEQCPLVDCDCSSLLAPDWQAECEQQQQHLQASCTANGGKPTGFCLLHGPAATPLPLNLRVEAVSIVDKAEIKALKQKVKTLHWSVKDDLEMARQYLKRGEVKRSLMLRKTRDKTFAKAHQIRAQMAASWIALDDADEAVNLWQEAAEQDQALSQLQLQDAEAMWKSAQQVGADVSDKDASAKEQRALHVLAMRMLKNAGNSLERAADGYGRAGAPEQAASQWQAAAKVSEQLLDWKVSLQEKSQSLAFYRQQSASRWYRAALAWQQTETLDSTLESAELARSEAERVLAGERAIAEL